MSVNLSPVSARRYSVGAADDPYKKYWWAILAGFVVTGGWLFLPMMDTPVGSIHVDTSAKPGADAAASDQSLDSVDNPSGAPGGALDLAMDGAKRKSKSGDEDMASMLYQPGPAAGAAAAGKPLGDATAASAASIASLAQQLKDAGKKADASGWTEKAQRGFNAPHLAGAGLAGRGAVSGGSCASAGGNGAFGLHNANVGFETAHGLQDDGADSPGLKALKAAGGGAAPNLKGSDEALHAGGSAAFDGGKGKTAGSTIGMGTGAMAQAHAALDAAPANLKQNDPKLNSKTLPDPPSAPPPPSSSNMGQQMAMMLVGALVGGMVGGMAGQMIMMMGTTMMQQQQAQAAAAKSAASTSTTNTRLGAGS